MCYLRGVLHDDAEKDVVGIVRVGEVVEAVLGHGDEERLERVECVTEVVFHLHALVLG